MVFILKIGFNYDYFELTLLGAIAASILFESGYYLAEKKAKEVKRFTTGSIHQYRRNSILLFSFSVMIIIGNIYYSGLILKPNFPMLIFLVLGLRGIVFTKQTVESVRVFRQGIEYGFWLKQISWNSILNYSVHDDFIYLQTNKNGFTPKEIRLEFTIANDVLSFENILKAKNIKSLAK